MKRVLITGAGGFVGQRCLPLLQALGYDVHAVSRFPRFEETAGVRWHDADLLNETQVSELLAQVKPTHLMHLAWYT